MIPTLHIGTYPDYPLESKLPHAIKVPRSRSNIMSDKTYSWGCYALGTFNNEKDHFIHLKVSEDNVKYKGLGIIS